MPARVRVCSFMLVACLLVTVGLQMLAPTAQAGALVRYPGIDVSRLVSDGLTVPTAARVAADGRIFVANKSGTVLEFDGPGDTTPVETLDVTAEAHDVADRGLLGIELDPGFTSGRPYLYAL